MTGIAERVFKFQGALAPESNPSLRCAVSIRYHRWDPTSLEVELLWLGDEDEKRASAQAIRFLPMNHLVIHSVDATHPSIELLGISHRTISERLARMGVAAIEVGISDKPLASDDSYHAVARLQPSGILCSFGSKHFDYRGGIKVERIEEGVISFEASVGSFEACETYEYLDTAAHGNKVTEQIQRASVMGNLKIELGDTLNGLHKRYVEALGDVCAILSLCYRQPVSYYEIEYSSLKHRGDWPALYRRCWSSSRERRSGDELIAARNLTNGGLQKLLNELACVKSRDSLLRSMHFLAASYEATVEIGYFMAFSAMENAVNSCLEEHEMELVTKSQWKKMEPVLREAINEKSASIEVSDVARDEIKRKLPELRRASLQSRVECACRRFEPKTSDLWPIEGFSEGIRKAASTRNDLFHSADAEGAEDMYGDLVRIRTFTERLLLQILKWPPDDIWVWYDQDLKWLNGN